MSDIYDADAEGELDEDPVPGAGGEAAPPGVSPEGDFGDPTSDDTDDTGTDTGDDPDVESEPAPA